MKTTKKAKKTGIRRFFHIIGMIVATLIGIIVLALAGIYTAHRLSLKSEAPRIENYGKKLSVFDGKMNILDEGKGEGKEIIVLLTGYGTASPGLDFTPLVNNLKKDYRVVVIEPFGYGLSSQTKRPRTSDNMVEEIHEVTKQLKLDSFILMGHSISGIYSLNYANTYPEQLKAFVGIDTSTSNQPWPGFNDGVITFVQKAGILRAITKLNPEASQVKSLDAKTNEQIRLLTMKNGGNETVRNEGQELKGSFELANKQTFPKNLPVLLFVVKDDSEVAGWLELHQKQVEHLDKGKVIELTGTHYLHHTQSERIGEEVRGFLN